MNDQRDPTQASGRFDVKALAEALPDTADTLLVDLYLTDRGTASARVFRVYKPLPPHWHRGCDEYLYVLSGEGTFWMGNPATEEAFRPGQLLFFERGTVHALPRLTKEPVTFLSVDAPRREPTDVVFVDPRDGSPEAFVERNVAPDIEPPRR